jgi:hypothetical protein
MVKVRGTRLAMMLETSMRSATRARAAATISA